MTAESTLRAFLAIELSQEILREIGRVQARLKNTIHGDVRWVRPESIHLTLKFIGDISEDEVAGISAVADKTAAAVGPFELAIDVAGVFPDVNRPRIIWLGMSGEVARLVAFQKELERGLLGIGIPREVRPFRPHLTLGRIRAPKGLMGVAEALKKGETCEGRYTASGLSLFKSDLTPQGALYTRIARYPFKRKEGA